MKSKKSKCTHKQPKLYPHILCPQPIETPKTKQMTYNQRPSIMGGSRRLS